MRILAVIIVALFASDCSSIPGTKTTLEQYIHRPISEFIDHHGYPVGQPVELPGGTKTYHFVNENGAFLEGRAGAWSHPCHVWLEVDATGTVLKYRFEGCD